MMFLGFIALVLKNLMLGSDILTTCFNFFGKHQIITEKIAGLFLGSLTNKNCFDVFGEIGICSCSVPCTHFTLANPRDCMSTKFYNKLKQGLMHIENSTMN
jgi:hypothetical protein